ncbi:hypothetical protein QMK17_03445 [Rhodococcus sp. G-MC3]|uniref:hypothetical protein n=1 Tax=Rhodococcus sp. G-MC3 TaxID=3046209 RepID=UPI0024BA8EA5|nr:hypothetical protein [Rhodococcus sp. G-MC3]MDJ0392389.1 hypothetical protein [Rhodococcus sp. G-MC3]
MTTSNVRRRQTGLPPEFARLPMRMVRAATAADVYAHPRAELSRLTDLGLLHRVATGFYVAVPDDQVGTKWIPGLEAAAAGIAVAAYSTGDAVVMGISAARMHVQFRGRWRRRWLRSRRGMIRFGWQIGQRWSGSSSAIPHV